METSRNKYKLFSKTSFYIGIFLLSFIFFNIFVSSIFLIFKITINIANIFISLGLSILLNIYLINKDDNKNKYMFILTIILPILIIIFSIFISGKIYDYSSDGNSYHKATIGSLVNGWNPIYESLEEYDQKLSNPMNIKWNSYTWANHYAKASHLYAANISILTNNIETGKSINILSIIMLFLFLFSTLLFKNKEILFSLLFSISIITCPTICSQFLTNYIDILVYIYFFLLIFIFFALEKSNLFNSKNIYLIIYFMLLIIMINLKFSLFGYAGIFCLGYYIWYIIRLIKKEIEKKYFIKFSIISASAVLLAVFVVGLSVYPKNFIEKGNPFYPLMGENKIDIMTMNQPSYFNNKSAIEKFIISTFSKSSNIMGDNVKAEYKIPFSITGREVTSLYNMDLRIAGNGVLFSGILIISALCLIIYAFKTYKKDKKLFYMVIIPIIITFIMIFVLDESWWARYFPQIHLIVFFAIILLKKSNTKLSEKIIYILITLILINNFIVFYNSVEHSYNFTSNSNIDYQNFEKITDANNCKLELYTNAFDGAIYNISEKYVDYNINYITAEEYQKDNTGFQKLMDGFVLYRCDKES